VEAMQSGRLAGEYALAYLGASSEKKANTVCKDYERAWFERRGRSHAKLAKVKHELRNIPDAAYNKGAAALAAIPQEDLTMSKIFGLTLGTSPRLVWALRHLM
jgi:flavin-dependent dehydrogenase